VVELGPDRTCPIGSVGSVTVVVSSDEKFAGDLEPALKSTFDDNFFNLSKTQSTSHSSATYEPAHFHHLHH
jgi:hypothetical protein